MKENKLKKILLKNKNRYILIVFLMFLINVLSLIAPIVIGYTTDYLLANEVSELTTAQKIIQNLLGGYENIKENVWLLGMLIVLVGLAVAVLNFLKGRNTAILGENIAEEIRNELFKHLINLPYSYFNNINTGDIIQRCTSDVDNIRMFLSMQIVEAIRISSLVIVALVYMLNINAKLSLYGTFLLPFAFIIGLAFVKLFDKTFKEFEEKEGRVNTVIQENASGVRVVKACNNQIFEIEKFDEVNYDFMLALRKLLRAFATFWSSTDFLCITQYSIAVLAGAYYGYKGIITTGEYIVFITYCTMVIWPVRQLGRILSEIGKTKVSYERLKEIFDTPVEIDLDCGEKPNIDGDIEFKNFNFKFEDEESYTLKNINLKIKKGENVGILGSIGSGKSTLMHMLLRLHNYDEGSITINNHEIKNINKLHLRNNIGMALQDNFLYGKTIIENLKIANPQISNEEVFDITEIAHIHKTFEKFSEGYETQVGEKGVTLSGGQKQRATIARTLLKKTGILIFDDSLSAVDAETDANIRKNLKKINNDVTTIIIAQRINTIMECDKIVVMDKGEITHIGTHDELINVDGIYKEVWDIQNMENDK